MGLVAQAQCCSCVGRGGISEQWGWRAALGIRESACLLLMCLVCAASQGSAAGDLGRAPLGRRRCRRSPRGHRQCVDADLKPFRLGSEQLVFWGVADHLLHLRLVELWADTKRIVLIVVIWISTRHLGEACLRDWGMRPDRHYRVGLAI